MLPEMDLVHRKTLATMCDTLTFNSYNYVQYICGSHYCFLFCAFLAKKAMYINYADMISTSQPFTAGHVLETLLNHVVLAKIRFSSKYTLILCWSGVRMTAQTVVNIEPILGQND